MKESEPPSEPVIVVRYTTVTRGDPFYASGKLSMAVHVLATSYGTLRSRLYDAYLEFSILSTRDFPPSLQGSFQWIKKELTKREAHGNEGRVKATLRGMRKVKAEEIAARICELSDALDTYLGQHDT